jgi:hypothetical protein
MLTKLEMQAIPEIRKSQPSAKDKFRLCDAEGFREMLEHHRQAGIQYGSAYDQAIDGLRHGDAALSARAERYLARFEDDVFTGQGFSTRNSVVGGVPNIGAYLAGNPMNMRQRFRTTTETAPLAIFLELTGSAGISEESYIERGAAMLALVRLLSNTRAIELWTCTTYGGTGLLKMIACKIDTQPLDVARASYVLCGRSLAMPGYFVNGAEMGSHTSLGGVSGWAYGVPELERKWAGEILRRIINPGMEMVYLPAAHLSDIREPEAWVRDMLARYSGIPQEAE